MKLGLLFKLVYTIVQSIKHELVGLEKSASDYFITY